MLLLSVPPRKRRPRPLLGRPTGATVAQACESRPLARLLLDGPWDTRRVLLLSRGAGPGWVPRGIALIYASLARRPLFPLLSWISSRQPSVYFGLRSLMHTSSNRSNSSGVAEDACEPNCASHRGGDKAAKVCQTSATIPNNTKWGLKPLSTHTTKHALPSIDIFFCAQNRSSNVVPARVERSIVPTLIASR